MAWWDSLPSWLQRMLSYRGLDRTISRIKQLKSETEQIRNETEQLKRENARLATLNARTKSLLSYVDQHCFPDESNSTPLPPTEPGSSSF